MGSRALPLLLLLTGLMTQARGLGITEQIIRRDMLFGRKLTRFAQEH